MLLFIPPDLAEILGDCLVRAAVLESPGIIVMKEFEKTLPRGSILLKVGCAGICGTDTHTYNKNIPGKQYPHIMGHEISGTIEAISLDCKVNSYDKLSVGDNVAVTPGVPCKKCYYCKTFPHMANYCPDRSTLGSTFSCKEPPYLLGGFAEHIIIPAGFWLHKLPENMSLEVGSLAEPLAVAVRAVGRTAAPGIPYAQMGLGPGTSIVVQGAGPIGMLVAICAKFSGASVTLLDKISYRLELAKAFGIKNVIDVSKIEADTLIETIKEMFNGIGPDAVIEATGELDAVSVGIKLPRRGGRYVELGHFVDEGNIQIKPNYLCRNDLEIVGSVLGSPQDYRRVLYILSDRSIPFEKIITHRFKLEDAEAAILNAKARNGLKSVIIPNM